MWTPRNEGAAVVLWFASYGCAAFVCGTKSFGVHHERLSTVMWVDQPSRIRGNKGGARRL
jgi:hypothetical protein